MTNLSKPDQKHLGALIALLLAHITLFLMSHFLRQTTLCSKSDPAGIKTALFYHISALLLSQSNHFKSLLLHFSAAQTSGLIKVNAKATFTFGFILPLFTEEYYEKSFASLGVALSMVILCLALLVIIQPRTDNGILDFIIGLASSVAYNLYGFTYPLWVVSVCVYMIYKFKCRLDRWMDLEVDSLWQPCQGDPVFLSHVSKLVETIEGLMVTGFYVYWDLYLLRTNFQTFGYSDSSESILSCSVNSLIGLGACVAILVLWFALAVVPRFFSLLLPAELRSLAHAEPEEIIKEKDKKEAEVSMEESKDISAIGKDWEEEDKNPFVRGAAVTSFRICNALRLLPPESHEDSGKDSVVPSNCKGQEGRQTQDETSYRRRLINQWKILRKQRKQMKKIGH